MTWRRTQSSINKYVPDIERSPAPDTSPTSRGPTPLERSMQQARHAEDTPLDPRTTPQEQSSARAAHPRGSASQGRLTHTHASAKAASRTPTRPSRPPHTHPRVRHAHHPAYVRPSTYAPGEVPAPTQQAASLPVPRSPRASSPAPLRIPAFLEERRADIGQHPQSH